MEISIILDNKVVYSKEFKNYLRKLKYKVPDNNKMIEMENKFINVLENDGYAKYLYSIVTGAAITTCNYTMAYASTDLSQAAEKLKVSFNPIIELLAGLGFPLTYAMLIVGGLMVITGKKSKGLEVIKWAVIGYIGLQFVPFFLSLLAEIGQTLRNSL